MNKKVLTIIVITIFVIAGVAFGLLKRSTNITNQSQKVVYGVSPFQDTILPIVPEQQGWYKDEGLDVQLKVLDWGDVMSAVASGQVDVALQNFNSFQASAESINEKGGKVIFYYAPYIFKGAAIMIRGDAKLKPLSEFLKQYPNDKERAVLETVKQLQGKTIIATKGTEMEQIVLSAAAKAELQPDVNIKIVHAQPSDSLAAFLRGEGDGFSGGVTERTEAARHGAIVLIEASDLNPPTIDGFVTTKRFAQEHPEVLRKLVRLWFKTIGFMEEDLDKRAQLVTDYLATVGSTKYTTDEYKYVWFNLHVFFKSPQDVQNSILNPNGGFYWKKSWDANNEFLIKEKKIKNPIPTDLFWGEEVQKEL